MKTYTFYQVYQGEQMDCRGGKRILATFEDKELAEQLKEAHKDDWCPAYIRVYTFEVSDTL